ncbi:MAG: class I SAM-dependent methyltransferase [Bacteroidia bacterium]|nr:class I SAM-dependent methyltransferase [Bacteroidia bacterium]NNM15944.1 class I SAM-dependent methyltransferase [Bacteroidia bacterium]
MQSTVQVRRGYNRLAGLYDLLKQFVFGNALNRAELYSIESLKECDTVLILGGGTGKFLESLIRLNVKQIIYVELSDKMIEKTKKRIEKNNENTSRVIFVQKSWEEYVPEEPIDAIVCNFFLDMYTEQTIKRIIDHYAKSIPQSAICYITDFYLHSQSTKLSKYLVKTMYAFFVAMCGIEARQLPNIFSCFSAKEFDEKTRLKSNYLRQSIFQKK